MKMKYCLGLDLGVTSIGSCVTRLDEKDNPVEIVDAGSRIFPLSPGAKERRMKNSMRKNNKRTHERIKLLTFILAENGFLPLSAEDFYRNMHLTPVGVSDYPAEMKKLLKKSPYKMRKTALDNKLSSPFMIGRIILHLAKHRGAGFIATPEDSNDNDAETSQDDNSDVDYEIIPSLLKKPKYRTVGELFYYTLSGEKVCNKELRIVREKDKKSTASGDTRNWGIARYLVEDEFEKIWEKQSEFYPKLKDENFKKKVKDILFYEKRHAPYAIGTCSIYPDELRLSKHHPAAELKRIYETVNNIRVITSNGTGRVLEMDERNKLVDNLLNFKKSLKSKDISKLLNCREDAVILGGNKEIKPYFFNPESMEKYPFIANISQSKLEEIIEFMTNPRVNPDDECSQLFNDEELKSKVCDKLQLIKTKENLKIIAEFIFKVKPNSSRTSYGKKATKMILEVLKQNVYDEASARNVLFSKGFSEWESEDEKLRRQQGKYSKLPYYGEVLKNYTEPFPPFVKKQMLKSIETRSNSGESVEELRKEIEFGKIGNPGVHAMLNELRRVVNEIISIYGKPCEIHIELARDAGLSEKKKDILERQNRYFEDRRKTACQELSKYGYKTSETNITKWLLAKDQGFQDIYDYNRKGISIENLSSYEIEHIIPRSAGGNNAFSNLALTVRHKNKAEKGDLFFYEYARDKYGTEKANEMADSIKSILSANIKDKKLLLDKLWRFKENAREIFTSHNGDGNTASRSLQDTRYFTRLAMSYLRCILDCGERENKTVVIRGSQTDRIKSMWGLEGIEYDLMQLNVSKYSGFYWENEETGEIVELEEMIGDEDKRHWHEVKIQNPHWQKKPRIDHRHHAVDAAAISLISLGFLQRLSKWEKEDNNEDWNPYQDIPFNLKRSEFRKLLLDKISAVKVSHKPDHAENGRLHEETGLKIVSTNGNNYVTRKTRRISSVVNRKVKSDIKLNFDFLQVKPEFADFDCNITERQEELKKLIEEKRETAKQCLAEENKKRLSEAKKEKTIDEKAIALCSVKLALEEEKKLNKYVYSGIDLFYEFSNKKALAVIQKHGNIGYALGNNHHIDFYINTKGKVEWQCVSLFDYVNKNYVSDCTKENGKMLWRLSQGDVIELNKPEEWNRLYPEDAKRVFAVVVKFGSISCGIVPIFDARASRDDGSGYKERAICEKGLSFFTKNQACKVELTPFGKVKKKHKKLFDGKKVS